MVNPSLYDTPLLFYQSSDDVIGCFSTIESGPTYISPTKLSFQWYLYNDLTYTFGSFCL